ncbi:DUF3800 domain-containing protein [Actinoplanes derwentensis]|nr:DUF3800 domain-containing protein [Actinoplanes derwentensis]
MTGERTGRSPLQGGLPPDAAVTGDIVEIACDESGFSGTNLLHSTEPMITHASTDLRRDEAAVLITALRTEFRLSPHELKSGHFLRRPNADEATRWFLAALHNRARVELIDKRFFLVTRIFDLLLTEPSYLAGTHLAPASRQQAQALHKAAHQTGAPWQSFLSAFEDLARTKRRRPAEQVLEAFFHARDNLLATDPRQQPTLTGTPEPTTGNPTARTTTAMSAMSAVLTRLDRSRVREILARLDKDDRDIPPPLEPMLPALAETILFWSGTRPPVTDRGDHLAASRGHLTDPTKFSDHLTDHEDHRADHEDHRADRGDHRAGYGQRQVLVIHDEQSALTADRLIRLGRALADHTTGVSPLAGLVMADSRDDPRIQVADLLAGIARRRTDLLTTDLLSPTSLRAPEN